MDNLDEYDHQAIIIWYCQEYYYHGMYQQAKQASHDYPNNENIKILLAVSYLLTNHTEEALQLVTDLISHDDTTLPALLIQSYVYRSNNNKDKSLVTQIDGKIREDRRKATATGLTRAALVLLLLKKFDKAKDYAEKAYKLRSNDFEVLLINGLIDLKFSIGKNTNYFNAISKEHSRKLIVLLGTAKQYELNESHDQAILILNALIVRYPKICIPLIEKMYNQLALKDWDQVIETANRILSIDTNNLDGIKAKTVVIFIRDGDYTTGSKDIQLFFRNLMLAEQKNIEIITKNIKLFTCIINRDELILQELIKVMEKLIQQNSNLSEPMIELGNIFLMLNKIKEAEHWYRSAIRIDESSFSALMGLAHCQVLDSSPGSIDLARQQIDFLMEVQSNSLDPRLHFMSAQLCRNDTTKALNYLNMSVKLILKNIENIPFGYKYLYELNPDFCLEIVNQHLTHTPTIYNNTGPRDDNENLTVVLLNKVADACPGFGAALLLLAKASMQNGDFEEALAALKKLIDSVDPANASAHLLMAQIFTRQADYQSASTSLEVGLSYNFKVRDDPLYHLITGIIERNNGNLESSITSLRMAMTLIDSPSRDTVTLSSSDKATLYLELISAYSELKKFDEAAALTSEAKMQFVNTVEEGRVIIGNAELCLMTGDIDKAINYLNDIQAGQPYYLQAHTMLANIYLNQRKDRHSFAKCFRELVDHCPGPRTFSMLGDAYMAIQEPDRAIEAYEESLKNNPGDKTLASKMGKALVKTHQYGKAINYYKEVVKNKSCGDLKLDMAELFMRMKHFDKAEAVLIQELQDGRMATDLASLEVRGKQLLMLAKVRERAGDIKLAISTLKEARENQVRCMQRASIVPSGTDQKQVLVEICLMLAEHSTAIRDFDEAIGYYKDALQHRPKDIKALLSLAKLYMQVNDLDKCALSCSALLNADPNNEAASVMMADLAFRKVDFETAAFHFRQLLLRKPTYWTALARLIEVSRRTGSIEDLNEWIARAEAATEGSNHEAGFYYCAGLLDWRTGKLNSALRSFNAARRDPEWGQQAIYNMIEICLDPDDDSALSSEAFNEEDAEYQDSRTMALRTAERLLQELNPKGSPHEILTHRLLSNFFLLATKIKSKIEQALQDCTVLASQETLRDHVGPALGLATAHILLKQTPRARNHLKRVSKNVWTFEDAEYLERCWILLAEIYVQSNKYDLANELLRRVLQHNATCVRAHELSGTIAEKEQNYREAAIRYAQAWKFGGKTKLSSGYKLAYCCLKSKKYADAIQACNEVLHQNNDFPKIRKEILEKSINHIRT
ncbi:tetratricopeptide repeat protein 21B [Microplitis demolitor]|uniref:tetratricopeptide repeat protein 21B n=1 Tax=Microplitis demolitor TaxID=69319 RepID=UPI0004CD53FA|nr:tetratricopeptide repeat protein 21B [Microplitis demolitor]